MFKEELIVFDAPQSLRPPAKLRAGDLDRMRVWVWLVAALALCSVAVDGIIGIGHSGPPMSAFHAINTLLPPFSETSWQRLFAQFRNIPAFANSEDPSLTLGAFKASYMWEWASVSLVRILYVTVLAGVVLAVIRAFRGRWLSPWTAGIFVIVGVQALADFWFASHGLPTRRNLTQIPYAANLAFGAVLFSWAIVAARRDTLKMQPQGLDIRLPAALSGVFVLVFLEFALGGLTSGLNAGHAYNTWPLIDGAIVPADLWFFSPWWKNLVSNALTVQYLHRMVAYALMAAAAGLGVLAWRAPRSAGVRGHMVAATLCILAEIALGVAALKAPSVLWLAFGHLLVSLLLIAVLSDLAATLSLVHPARYRDPASKITNGIQ